MPVTAVAGHLHLLGVPLTAYISKESVKLIGLKLYFLFCFAVQDSMQAKHSPINACERFCRASALILHSEVRTLEWSTQYLSVLYDSSMQK